ncbi:hypothetical protein [Shewanella sp. MEBiC00475]|uniref:hypothetical protein n=1 Tax=Shewanella sp. MEBiC00475 TaxID=2575361 RepID=UPI0010C0792F|nr:hypothetical protein [Shewanella sp. MEBiC00475]
MNLLDDIEVNRFDTGIYKGFEGQIFDIGEANKLALALKQGREKDLIKHITETVAVNPKYVLSILDWSFLSGSTDLHELSCWILTQDNCLPTDSDLLNFGIRLSVERWRADGIKKFLSLGANPNQEILPRRNIYDVCLNRSHHAFYFDDNVVTDAIDALNAYQARAYLIEKYEGSISCLDTLKPISTHDSWCELFFKSIEQDDENTQMLWCNLINKCVNKAKKPSKKWLKDCLEIVDSIGVSLFGERAQSFIIESHNQRDTLIYGELEGGPYYKGSASTNESFDLWKISESSSYILKSIMWLLMNVNHKGCIEVVYETCKVMYQTHELLGIRDVKLANACFTALLESENGAKFAKSLFDETTHKPTLNKMKVLLNLNLK